MLSVEALQLTESIEQNANALIKKMSIDILKNNKENIHNFVWGELVQLKDCILLLTSTIKKYSEENQQVDSNHKVISL